jgi:hypothetical protein
MKSFLKILIATFLFGVAHAQCLAMISVELVSKERAKELGVTFQTNTNGAAGIQVRMEFKAEGELKKITYIEVQIGEGEGRIMSAALPVFYSTPEKGVVSFSAFPAYLPGSSLMIVVYHGPKGDVGYRFKVKDFIELEKPR